MSDVLTDIGCKLPQEIWTEILGWVAHVDGALDTHVSTLHPGLSSNRSVEAIQSDILRNQKPLTRLSLVCKEWHAMAIKLFFRYIVLRRFRTITELLEALEKSKAQRNDGFGYGFYTLRLDINLKNGGSTAEDAQRIAAVIKHLPGLRIFTCRGNLPGPYLDYPLQSPDTTVIPNVIIQSLIDTCGDSLRVFNTLISSSRLLCDLIRRGHLETLVCRIVGPMIPSSMRTSKIEPIICPKLDYLEIVDRWDEDPTVFEEMAKSMTSLTQLAYSYPPCSSIVIHRSILPIVGSHLTTLQLALHNGFSFSRNELPELHRLCPNLQTLLLDIEQWILLHRALNQAVLPKIKLLGLRKKRVHQDPRADWVELCQAIKNFVQSRKCPTLRAIRFMDQSTALHVVDRHSYFVSTWEKETRSNVVLEDSTGENLSVVLTARRTKELCSHLPRAI